MTGKSSATVPIIVAVIGVVGTITTALIANWDKIAGTRANDPAVAKPKVQDAPADTPREQAVRVQPAESASIDVSGTWSDGGAYRFVFTQRGEHYSFRQLKYGALVGSGEGVLTGRSFRHNFRSDEVGTGTCVGEVSADGNVSSGTCSNGINSWPTSVFRTSG